MKMQVSSRLFPLITIVTFAAPKSFHLALSSFVCSGCDALLDSKILSSDINDLIQAAPVQVTHAYHTSICGSILHSAPSNSSADIFSYLRHANFDAFRRSLDLHHNDIIRMRNEHEQVGSSSTSSTNDARNSAVDCPTYLGHPRLSLSLGTAADDAWLRHVRSRCRWIHRRTLCRRKRRRRDVKGADHAFLLASETDLGTANGVHPSAMPASAHVEKPSRLDHLHARLPP